jgi:hypothetical protein
MNSAISYRSLSIVYEEPVAEPFKMTIDTTQPGGASDTFILPLQNTTNNFVIDWGDGSSETVTTVTSVIHTYASGGTYQISFDGSFSGIKFNNTGDKLKFSSIDSWGTNQWLNMEFAFYGCSNMIGTYTDSPDISLVPSMRDVFRGCSEFNSPFNVDTSNISERFGLWGMFTNCLKFNQPIHINGASIPPTGIMSNLFAGCRELNSLITFSNMMNLEQVQGMFNQCLIFNQPVDFGPNGFSTASSLFANCQLFNQDVSGFQTSTWTNMISLFAGCSLLDPDVSGWDISSLQNANIAFTNSGLSTANYDSLLVAWDGQGTSFVTLNASPTQYSAGAPATARANMIDRGWAISDGGQA